MYNVVQKQLQQKMWTLIIILHLASQSRELQRVTVYVYLIVCQGELTFKIFCPIISPRVDDDIII